MVETSAYVVLLSAHLRPTVHMAFEVMLQTFDDVLDGLVL
jgi:hypothetical protein